MKGFGHDPAGQKEAESAFITSASGILFAESGPLASSSLQLPSSISEFYQLDFYVKETRGALVAAHQFTAGNYYYAYQALIIPLEVLLFLPESVSFNSQVRRGIL